MDLRALFALCLATAACSSETTTPAPAPPDTTGGDAGPGPAAVDPEIVTGSFTKLDLTSTFDKWSVADLYVAGQDDVYISTRFDISVSTVYHFDGTRFTEDLLDQGGSYLFGVEDRVWSFGAATHRRSNGKWVPEGSTNGIGAMGGAVAKDVWGLSNNGNYIYRNQGTGFVQSTGPVGVSYGATFFAKAADQVWLTWESVNDFPPKDQGHLYMWNGKAWQDRTATLPKAMLDARRSFSGLGGSAVDDVWGIWGRYQDKETPSALAHWDGAAWSVVEAPGGAWGCKLSSVYASGPKNAWLTGTGGCLFHYDGATWSKVPSGVSTNLYKVHGAGPRNVWIVTEGKSVLRLEPK
jgi:hypothetical protein